MAAKQRKTVSERVRKQKPVPPTEAELSARAKARETKAAFGKATNKTFMPDVSGPATRNAHRRRKDDVQASLLGGVFSRLGSFFGLGGKQAKPRAKTK